MSFLKSLALVLAVALTSSPVRAAENAHGFTFTSIEGDPLSMARFAGKTVLVVNTASRCGFTGQYKELQALYDKYREQGFVVLGVPSNDFRQELSSAKKVKNFCEVTYGIDFPMTDIVRVKGTEAHPMFRWMAAQGSEPNWNFHKFLIGSDGALIADFRTQTWPDDAKVVGKIEAALGR